MQRRFGAAVRYRVAAAGRWTVAVTIAIALATSACSDGERSGPVSDGGLLGLSFDTVSDAASAGDFAVVFDVVAEREFSDADISRPADGSPPTSPPTVVDDDYVGRVVRVVVNDVIWEDGERDVPSEFEFVTAGWTVQSGSREAADDGWWYRVEVGRRYFGVFADSGDEIGPVSVNAIYGIEGDRLVEVSSAGGPERFDGATLSEVAVLLDYAATALGDSPHAGTGSSMPPMSTVAATQPDASPSTSVQPAPTVAAPSSVQYLPMSEPQSGELVVERRSVTDAELSRLDDDDGIGATLDCDDYGAATWDYGPVGPDDPTGRQASDALLDAVETLNAEREREGGDTFVPTDGWLELTHDTGRQVTFVHGPAEWRYIIEVGGDPTTGVWRHHSALLCNPDTTTDR